MESNRNLITTEPQGGPRHGTDFDDKPTIQDLVKAVITWIDVAHSTYINSLTVHYEGQTHAIRRGGNEGPVSEIVLQPGEFITIIEGNASTCGTVIGRLSFVSNKGRRWGPYGQNMGQGFIWDVASLVSSSLAQRMGLLCFKGSGQTYISHLQATFAIYPGFGQPPKDVKYEQQTRDRLNPNISVTLSKFAKNLMSPVVILEVGADQIKFHAYENMLCRLPFFHAALKGAFKEASDKKITMPEDKPEIVAALIEFLSIGTYTYTYDPEGTTVSAENTPVSDLREGSFHVRVYALASKYDYQPLVDAAIRSLTYVMKQIDGIDVVRLLKETYDKGWVTSEWEDDKDMAEFKHRFPDMLKRLYVTNPEEMRGLITECPDLANDLLRLVVSK